MTLIAAALLYGLAIFISLCLFVIAGLQMIHTKTRLPREAAPEQVPEAAKR